MKFIAWFMALGLMTIITACGGAETPEVEEDMPATEETEDTEMMEEEEEEETTEEAE
jgi:ABC-type glycerol-3-phosphate transport system substrate-binding protein